MKLARASQHDDTKEDETLFAIVTVGRYSRFYELLPRQPELSDYPNTKGQPFEFKKDKDTIDAILLDLVKRTTH